MNPQGDNPRVVGESPTITDERIKGFHSLFMLVKENLFSNIQECIDPILVPPTLPFYNPLDSSNHLATPSSLDHSPDSPLLPDQPSIDSPTPLRVYV